MIYDKDSMSYQLNKVELEDMERHVPMTLQERTAIRFWVRRGHSVESNPWDYRDSSGELMNFLQAFRIRFGYVRGPWDYWHGEESCSYHDDDYDYWDSLAKHRPHSYRLY